MSDKDWDYEYAKGEGIKVGIGGAVIYALALFILFFCNKLYGRLMHFLFKLYPKGW